MPKLGMEAIRRRQVIDAVVKILETQGWKDLTIREVSEVAGVSAGILTHYFGNKRSMTIDSITEAHARSERALQDIERRRLGPAERLLAVIDVMAAPAAAPVPGASFWLAIAGRMPFDRVIQAEMQKLHERSLEFLRDIIAQGAAQGAFRPAAPATDIAERCLALASGLDLAGVRDPAGMPPARRRDLLLDQLRRDLAADLAGAPAAPATAAVVEPVRRRR
jgi:AcrR family transcriptional regulator